MVCNGIGTRGIKAGLMTLYLQIGKAFVAPSTPLDKKLTWCTSLELFEDEDDFIPKKKKKVFLIDDDKSKFKKRIIIKRIIK